MLHATFFLLLSSIRSFTTQTTLSREQVSQLLDDVILPKKSYGDRIRLGRDAQNLDEGTLVRGSDPVLAFTYGEFPLSSLDILVDTATQYITSGGRKPEEPLNILDVGSGCGRCCLYLALTRQSCTVTGIEISDLLHKEADRMITIAEQQGYLASTSVTKGNQLLLFQGSAEEHSKYLNICDILFCYSTTWDTSDFSVDLGAMVLSDEWNQLFSTCCRSGTIAITTDRALDPTQWNLLHSIEVENPEVGGSMGYIQRRK